MPDALHEILDLNTSQAPLDIGGIPCLFKDNKAALRYWRGLAQQMQRQAGENIAMMARALGAQNLLPATRQRLQALHHGVQQNIATLLNLLAEAGITPQAPVGKSAKSNKAETFPQLDSDGLLGAYVNLMRDWAWPTASNSENRQALEALQRVLDPQKPLGTVLVLGSGGSRLAYDVHRHFHVDMTIAVDINPLLLLIAKRLIHAQQPLRLAEFPIHPKTAQDACAWWDLQPPAAVENFHFLLADGLNPPLRGNSIDTVLTPWFIDQIPARLDKFLQAMQSYLKPGGRWLNFGPLIYPPARELPYRYTLEEVIELTRAKDFEIGAVETLRMPYLHSPVSAQGRMEDVYTFSATSLRARELTAATPAWFKDVHRAVPRFQGLESFSSDNPVFAAVADLIDGRRSLAQIGQVLQRQYQLPADKVIAGVKMAVAEIYAACGHGRLVNG